MKELKWLWGYIKEHTLKLFFGISMVIFFTAISTLIPYITGDIVDKIIVGGEKALLNGLLIALIVVTLGRTGSG